MKPPRDSRLEWLAVLIFSVFVCGGAGRCEAFDTVQHWNQRKETTPAEYFQKFPYDAYLRDIGFTDFARLQQDRYFFWKQCGDGDPFLYGLGNAFAHQYPLPDSGAAQTLFAAYGERINIGEAFRAPNKGFNRGTDAIYQIMGNYLLGQVAQAMERAAHRKVIQLDSPDCQRLIHRLADSRVYLQLEESEHAKFVKHLRAGNLRYLFVRVSNKLSAHRRTCAITLFTLAVSVAVIVFIVTRKPLRTGIILATGCLVAKLGLDSLAPEGGRPATALAANQSAPSTEPLRLAPHRQFYPVAGAKAFGFEVLLLLRRGELIGSSFWFDRHGCRAAYLATDVPRDYPPFFRANHVLAVVAGGFTNSFSQPEGLTLQSGNIVNSVLMPDRHALVLVEPEGGIRVLNLRQARIDLPLGANKTKTIQNPLGNLLAYAELLEWCRARKVTMFQTQLLAFSDNLLIDVGKAKPELRERRILALVSEPASRGTQASIHHIIFNVVAPSNLAVISEELFSTLKSRKLKIEALLNLDVGAYNILQSFDDRGAPLNYTRQIGGRHHDLLCEQRDPASGTNLLAYIHE